MKDMDQIIELLARELAGQLNEVINLPFLSEEDEEIFYRIIILNLFKIMTGKVILFR